MKVIDVRNVYLKYPSSKEATIKGISFDVKQGEIFGFLGPSGASIYRQPPQHRIKQGF